MKRRSLTVTMIIVLALMVGSQALAREASRARPSDPQAAAAMAAAAERFLAALTPELRAEATFAFEDAERTRWHFIPGEMHARRGAVLKSMTPAHRQAAHALLRSGLSEGGFATATAVMELEGILRELEGAGARFARDPELYYFSVFGTPSPSGTWAWRVEGHHLSLHFTVVNGRWVASAPAFLGANPAEVREGPRRGMRILADREDVARRLLISLDPSQRSTAIISTDAPNDIVTGADLDIRPLTPVGIAASALRAEQRELLNALIEVYASIATESVAAARLAAIREAGTDAITFAWAGGPNPGDRHYYRIQGPTFLIEYDNTQNEANHIHSVWRDFNGDFGRDILREHLAAVVH